MLEMEEKQSPPPRRARRRILSCENCRRLKSRCEYDPRINACQRCHKLRIYCSLHSASHIPRTAPSSKDRAQDDIAEDRIANVENSLASVKESVDKIWMFLQQDGNRPLNLANGPLIHNADRSMEKISGHRQIQQSESAEFPPLHPAQGDLNKSAPIMIVRKFRSSARRLYENPGEDIVSKGILNEDVAERLVSEFILRLGHVIQVKTYNDLTTTSSIRQASPLLYAVCCLQAIRFFKDTDLVDTNDHRQLYEEVRRMLGQVILASPIPLEELYAMLIMCTFEAAPRPVFEYIESWHLSGICAQQAISTIDFAEIIANLSLGKHEIRDKRCLSLWNNICLVNLRFAVGTGKPATIPSELLDQCSAILNHPQATFEDGVVLAETLLFSTLCNKQAPPMLDRYGQCPELTAWEKRWAHLLKSDNAIYLRFGREFAYLVLAMRLVDKSRSSGVIQTSFQADPSSKYQSAMAINNGDEVDSTILSDSYQACAHKHAHAMARLFLKMPTALVQELPKFHHICIAYCSIVLSECADKSGISHEEVYETLSDVCVHYRRFSEELPAVMNVALEKMRLSLEGNAVGKVAKQTQSQYTALPIEQTTDISTVLDEPSHRIEGIVTSEQGLNTEFFDNGLGLLSFPTVDDFFGSWMMNVGNE